MNKIVDLIQEHCPDGVQYEPIGDVAECYAGATPRSGVAEYWENGTIPWMSSGEVNKKIIFDTDKKITQAGFDSCSTRMVPADTVVMALAGQGKTRGLVARTRIPLCTNQSLCSIISGNRLNSDFLYHYLATQYQQLRNISSGDGTRGGLNLQMIRSYKVPVPPLEVQKEIVSILDKFTQLEAELSAELDARRKQYEYYRNQLFVFDESREVKWSKLSDIARVTIGEFVHKNKQNPNGLYPVYNGGRSETGYFDEYNNTGEKIVISARGAYAGFVNRVMKPYWAGNSSYSIDVTDRNKVNWHYVHYYLKSSESKFTEQQQKGGIPAVSKKQVEVFKIPIPPLDEQDRIVSILDKFDNLTNSISEGLPAEINARRRQYEYYRTKLLTFQELSA